MKTTLARELFDYLFKYLNISDGREYYLYALPDTKTSDVDVFWMIPGSENLIQKNATGEARYLDTFTINYRSQTSIDADNEVSRVKEIINKLKCINLPHYEVVYIEATMIRVDNDLDVERAKRASLTINLRTYGERITDESS